MGCFFIWKFLGRRSALLWYEIKMKVAFITHYTSLYGANRSLLNLIDGLSKYDDVIPYLISPSKGEVTEALEPRNVPIAIFPIKEWTSHQFKSTNKPLKNLQAYIRFRLGAVKRLYLNLLLLQPLVNQLQKWEIDIVYTNSSVIPIGFFAAKSLGRPHVWHLREFCDLDYGLSFDLGFGIQKRIIKSSDAFFVMSEAICQHFLDNLEQERVHIIYDGVISQAEMDSYYQQNQHKDNNQRAYTFLIIGLLHPAKGQDEAIKALSIVRSKFPTTRLLIFGSGNENYLNYLKNLTHELDLKNNIEFKGYVQNPYTAYLQSDAVLMCSKNEGMGRVTVEGMSACKPVIGYDNAGTSELIEHEHTGLLYSHGHEELASNMLRLLENPEFGYEMGENAWQIARHKFTIESYADSVYRVLSSINSNS